MATVFHTLSGRPKDAINPDHYKTSTSIEAIDVMEAFCDTKEFRGHLKNTALKYILRLGKKDNEEQEINKAIWYLEKLKSTYKIEVADDLLHV